MASCKSNGLISPKLTTNVSRSVVLIDGAVGGAAAVILRSESAASAAGSTNLGALLRAKLDKSNSNPPE